MLSPDALAFLKRLLDTPGPSGYEGAPARVWRTEAATFATDIRADTMQMLGSRQGMGGEGGGGGYSRPAAPAAQRPAAPAASKPASASGFDDMDDDIPF